MASGKNKQYGLILSSKGANAKTATTSRKNVFGDDSESDSDDGGDWVKKSLKREAQKGVLKRTTKVQMKQALAEDPTVFQYDEIYDDLEIKKVEANATKKGTEKKPRYIQALLQTAEKRKKEHERRIERQVQKEREEEGNEFADKESFVTASYRQKLEEFKKQEEEEKRMERLEAIGDVTKQKDMTGFYRHLYRQTMGETLPGPNDAIKTEKVESDGQENSKITEEDIDQASKGSRDDKPATEKEERKKDRHYRKRRSSSSSSSHSDREGKDERTSIKTEKDVDADSDITGSSSSSSDNESSVSASGSEEGEITKKRKDQLNNKEKGKAPAKRLKQDKSDLGDKILDTSSLKKERSVSNTSISEKEKSVAENNDVKNFEKTIEENNDSIDSKTEEPDKPKINLWAKRTIGQLFDDAVQRYYERKGTRAAMRLGRA